MSDQRKNVTDAAADAGNARREFLKKYGRYAVVVPPAVTLLLASSSRKALASGGGTATR